MKSLKAIVQSMLLIIDNNFFALKSIMI